MIGLFYSKFQIILLDKTVSSQMRQYLHWDARLNILFPAMPWQAGHAIPPWLSATPLSPSLNFRR